MKSMTSEEIRQAVRGRWRWPAGAAEVGGVSTDTRACRPGDCFFALRGPNFDGHAFLPQAAEGGCVCAVVAQSAELPNGLLARFPGGVIAVDDTTAALGDLASVVRQGLSARVIGVTGSNGKTTVKRMIHHVLSRRLKGSASPKSFNNNIGVPLTLLAVGAGDDYVVCEIGTNAPGEVAALGRIARPHVAVITSVGPVHLERLIDLEHVAAEKASLLGCLADGGLGVVWADSPELERALRAHVAQPFQAVRPNAQAGKPVPPALAPVTLVRFGTAESADLRLTAYEPTGGGCRFEINGHLRAELPVPGRHNANNALAAIAVAVRLGFSREEAAKALRDFAGEAMRLQSMRVGDITLVNDAYNANPASLAAAAEVLAELPARRRVIVVGDMLELGPASVEWHRRAGAALAGGGLGLVVGVGALGSHVAAGAGETGGADLEAARFETLESAAAALPALLRAGDVVLLKGSRGMGMEKLVGPIQRAFGLGQRSDGSC